MAKEYRISKKSYDRAQKVLKDQTRYGKPDINMAEMIIDNYEASATFGRSPGEFAPKKIRKS